jgi:G3E family GTPase
LAAADLVVVNKADLVTPVALAATRDWLTMHFPAGGVLTSVQGAIALDVLLGEAAGSDRGRAAEPLSKLTIVRGSGAVTARPHQTTAYDTAQFGVDGTVDAHAIAAALADPGFGLVRAKGFVCHSDGQWRIIQVVGTRWTVELAPQGTVGPGRVVCIAHGSKIDRARIIGLLASHGLKA